ncbi:MAG TPA: NusG domain II-containing protein [Rhodocyclaceae bacterium]|nr:NusG domain II-containing protein [Rhodocyclaceae bacterium]
MKSWLALVRPGDWLTFLLVGSAVALAFPWLWQGGLGDKAVVRQAGQIVAELDLATPRTLNVSGPLGITTIAVDGGRARVLADPGPRQYCVRQGWLTRAGEIAICAPNRVSLAIVGRNRAYDSLNY